MLPHEGGRLRTVQGQVQAYVMGAGGDAVALVRPSERLSPVDRLDIYRGMYAARLVEALRVDYPGLIHFLGDEAFDELARLYLDECPSESYTLNRLGDRLPAFVERVEGLRRARFVQALAQLELAETMVFDEEEAAAASPTAIAGLTEEQWGRLRLRPIPALRMLRLAYPAQIYLDAMRDGKPAAAPRPKQTHLLVYRRNYAVFHQALTRPAFAAFGALAENGTLAEAMEAMFAAGGAREAQVFEWFQNWFSEGLFQSVELE